VYDKPEELVSIREIVVDKESYYHDELYVDLVSAACDLGCVMMNYM